MSSKQKTRNRKVILVDVFNLLHIGEHTFRNYSVPDVAGNRIPTGGMYMVMNLLRRVKYSHMDDLWVFCFDSKNSFRKQLGMQLGIEYKSGRSKPSSALLLQAEELKKWLPLIGYNTIALDGCEADDIINSIIVATSHYGLEYDIISTDRDYAFNVNDKISVISCNSKVPSVTKENYEMTVGNKQKQHKVFYNTALLYKVICGDGSDKIPEICKESYYVYLRICNALRNSGEDLSKFSDFDEVEKVVNMFEGELREKAENNWQMIKPFILPVEQIPIKQFNLNKDALYEFCSIFGMKAIAKKFGMELNEFPESVTKYRLSLTAQLYEKFGGLEADEISSESDEESETVDGLERIKQIEENEKDVAIIEEKLTATAISKKEVEDTNGDNHELISSNPLE